MVDGFSPAIPQESQEFEDFENAQQQAPVKPAQAQAQSKPADNIDIKDEVGQAIETATQSVFGPTDPIQIQKQQQEQAVRKQDDQRKLANVKQFLAQMVQDEQRNKQLTQEEQHKKMQEQQEEQEEKQEKELKKQKKDQSFEQQHIQAEQTKAERKLGVGG